MEQKINLEKYTESAAQKIPRLAMSLSEITDRFKHSDGKAKDMQVLAELNGCERNIIQEIIEVELGPEYIPKGMKKMKAIEKKNTSGKPVPAKKKKEEVSRYVMNAVVYRIEQVDERLKELDMTIARLQRDQKELEEEYRAYIEFMDTVVQHIK